MTEEKSNYRFIYGGGYGASQIATRWCSEREAVELCTILEIRNDFHRGCVSFDKIED